LQKYISRVIEEKEDRPFEDVIDPVLKDAEKDGYKPILITSLEFTKNIYLLGYDTYGCHKILILFEKVV